MMGHADGMSSLPTPLRAALGVAVVAVDTARTLPQKAAELPVIAVSTALQLSLRAQQRYAELTVRGDELIGRVRGVPDEAPPWATFDDSPIIESELVQEVAAADAADASTGGAAPGHADSHRADPRGADLPRPPRRRSPQPPTTIHTASVDAAQASDEATARTRKAVRSAAAKPPQSPAARRTTARRTSSPSADRSVPKPRNGAPSAFDSVGSVGSVASTDGADSHPNGARDFTPDIAGDIAPPTEPAPEA